MSVFLISAFIVTLDLSTSCLVSWLASLFLIFLFFFTNLFSVGFSNPDLEAVRGLRGLGLGPGI